MLCGKVPCKGSHAGTGGSEYLELHGAFSTSLRAPGTESLSRSGFLAGARSRAEIALGALRGVPAQKVMVEECAGRFLAGPLCSQRKPLVQAALSSLFIRYTAAMQIGGFKHKPDYRKLGPSLLIASCVILGLRTARWAIRSGASTASDRDVKGEVENAIHLAKRVLSHLLSKDAEMFPSVKDPWYQPTDEDVPK